MPGSVDPSHVDPSHNPYVGPRAFTEEEADFFFGRDQEVQILEGQVMARRASLFFAQSGAGKSSLLRAGLIPALTAVQELGRANHRRTYQKMRVLPVVTPGGAVPHRLAGPITNIFMLNVLLKLMPDEAPERLTRQALPDALEQMMPHVPAGVIAPVLAGATAAPPLPDALPAADSLSTLLIFDQFEELFTYYPERNAERADFFRQVAAALERYPTLHVLFTMREDYIAELIPFATLIPDQFRTRFRLERLRYDAALAAVVEPARRAGRTFADGVAEALVNNLRRAQVGSEAAALNGDLAAAAGDHPLSEYVEPVHLQIVCHELWAHLPPEHREIRSQDVQDFGDVDQALIRFYEGILSRAATQAGVNERQLRTWFNHKLITPTHTRALVYRDDRAGTTEGLPNAAVDILRDAYLIRANLRGGDIWYELAHDRLIEPILTANQRKQSPLEADAQTWLNAGRDAAYLYTGPRLQQAAAELEQNPELLGDLERQFVTAAVEADRRSKTDRQRRRSIGLALVILILSLLAVGLFLSRQDAVAQGRIAAEAAAIARAREADAQTARETAEAAGAAADQARGTAEAASTEALRSQAIAVAALETAVADRNAAQDAQATLLANLETQEAALLPTSTPTPTPIPPSAAGTPIYILVPTPTPAEQSATPTPDLAATATYQAIQDQKSQVQAAQEAYAPSQDVGVLEEPPFAFGVVVSFGGAEGDYLLSDPTNELSGVAWVTVGTQVELLGQARGSRAYGSGIWYYVTIADLKRPLFGWLPAEVVQKELVEGVPQLEVVPQQQQIVPPVQQQIAP
jgi:hypothetical protein